MFTSPSTSRIREQRSRATAKSSAAFIAALALTALVNGCATSPMTWTQIHGDPGNTNSAQLGASDLQAPSRTVVRFTLTGGPGTSSPVEGPNGSVYVSVYDGTNGQSSHIARVNTASRVPAKYLWFSHPGQISTAALDSLGNVYVVINSFGDQGPANLVELKSHIVKLDANGVVVWDTPVLLPRYQTPPPKIFEYNGKVNVFVPVRVSESIMAGVLDGATGTLNTVRGCDYSVDNPGIGATATPSSPTIPYSEEPATGVAYDAATTVPYLVMPSRLCGISFFQLAHDPSNVPWTPGLAYPVMIKTLDRSSSTYLSSPSISVFNTYALIGEDAGLRAYNYLTGAQISGWQVDTGTCLAPVANILGSMITCTNASTVILSPVDHPNIGPGATRATLDRVGALAVTPTNIYVLGRDGLFRYDTQMHLQSFAPTGSAGAGGIAIGSTGTVYATSPDQNLYIFPSQ
jgi:hypothetical protein